MALQILLSNMTIVLEFIFPPRTGFSNDVQANAKKTSYLFAIDMDFTEAIVNNSSVKTVRKLQVLLSLQQTVDENTAIK